MLSDSLHAAWFKLNTDYKHYKKAPFTYGKDTLDETKNILDRLDALREK